MRNEVNHKIVGLLLTFTFDLRFANMANSSARGFTFPCFKDKVVIITGASSGIGEATAVAFAKDGAKLALTGRNAERLNGVVQRCISEGVKDENIVQMIGEVTDEAFIEKFMEETVSKLGGVDVLFNNAGAGEFRIPGEFNKEKLDRIFDVFVRTSYTTIRCCLPHLKKSKGSIINMSSIMASEINNYGMEYGMCKSAVNHMRANLTYELAQDGIRINTISPGLIKTPMITSKGDIGNRVMELAGNTSGFKRVGEPEEVAGAVQFLASPAASYITGVDLVVDGGQTKVPIMLPEQLLQAS